MEAHRIETMLTQDGRLVLDHLPFHAGDVVEVIILAQSADEAHDTPYTLRTPPVRYDRPDEPTAESDWEAAQ